MPGILMYSNRGFKLLKMAPLTAASYRPPADKQLPGPLFPNGPFTDTIGLPSASRLKHERQ